MGTWPTAQLHAMQLLHELAAALPTPQQAHRHGLANLLQSSDSEGHSPQAPVSPQVPAPSNPYQTLEVDGQLLLCPAK